MDKNVKILTGTDISELELKLNTWFRKGYCISGGISVCNGWYMAVVTKPF